MLDHANAIEVLKGKRSTLFLAPDTLNPEGHGFLVRSPRGTMLELRATDPALMEIASLWLEVPLVDLCRVMDGGAS